MFENDMSGPIIFIVLIAFTIFAIYVPSFKIKLKYLRRGREINSAFKKRSNPLRNTKGKYSWL